MNFPQYPQQPMQPQYPQQGYPQPMQPQYAPQQPQQGYGPQGQPQQPTVPVQRWTGGAAFDAQPQNYEKRPSLSFKNAPIGTTRVLVTDLDPTVIHGKKYGTNEPDFDKKGNPKWTVGTGLIDEYGQKVTHWCGKWSQAAQQYTAARTANGIGPEDSMRGWVVFIQYTGTIPADVGEAKQYNISMFPIEQATQYLSAAQMMAAQQEGITQAEPPGNRKCAQPGQGQAAPTAAAQPQMPMPPAQPLMQPQQLPQPVGYGPGQPVPNVPPMQTAPGYPASPGVGPGMLTPPGQQAPQGYGTPQGIPPGTPQAAPQWPQPGQQGPAGPMGQGQPQPGAYAAQGGAPQGGYPSDPMAQAVHTIQQVFPGSQPVQQGQPQRPPSEVGGYRVDALAAYATMPDAVLASTGQDVNSVRAAIHMARQMGALPQAGGIQQGQSQDPPF